MFENDSILLIVAVSAIIVISIWILLRKRRKEHPLESSGIERDSGATNSEVDNEQIRRFKDENRILNVERAALYQAISYLYNAQADGKITDTERNKLIEKYRQQMIQVEREIDKNMLIADLQRILRKEGVETEEMIKGIGEYDLEKSERDKVINEEVTKPAPKKTSEERIEEIREEVLKTLDKLDKMDLEG
jgi:hypothetical protein